MTDRPVREVDATHLVETPLEQIAPGAAGPFVLKLELPITREMADRVLAEWEAAFARAGRPAPPLLVMDHRCDLTSVSADELTRAGLMRIPTTALPPWSTAGEDMNPED